MNFGEALELLKQGRWVARKGWHGKKMHVYLEDSFVFAVPHPRGKRIPRTYDACLVLFTAQETHQPGWLASQADMLAEDWYEVELG